MSYYEKATAEALRNLELQEQTAKLWKTAVDYEVENNFYSYKQAGPTDYQPNATTTVKKTGNKVAQQDVKDSVVKKVPEPGEKAPQPKERSVMERQDPPTPINKKLRKTLKQIPVAPPKSMADNVFEIIRDSKSQMKTLWNFRKANNMIFHGQDPTTVKLAKNEAGEPVYARKNKIIILNPGLASFLAADTDEILRDDYNRWKNFVGRNPPKSRTINIIENPSPSLAIPVGVDGDTGGGLTVIASRADAMDLLKSHIGQIQSGNDNRSVFNDTVEIVNFMKKQKWLTKKQYSDLIKMLY